MPTSKPRNAHDADQLGRLFFTQATYEDPMTRIPVLPYDIGAVVELVAALLPDFRFEVLSKVTSGQTGVVEWRLTGGNTKPWKPGIEATGKMVHLQGVEVFEGGSEFRRVKRYFDQKSMIEQIGMQVVVEPYQQGKATYGYSKRVASGNLSVPAVVGLTWINFRDQSELNHIRTHSARIIQNFLEEPGFISIVTGAAADRAFTVTAWDSEEALYRALAKNHSHVKHDFRTGDLSPGVRTSIRKPQQINRLWSRCLACGRPNDAPKMILSARIAGQHSRHGRPIGEINQVSPCVKTRELAQCARPVWRGC
jgi:hypothetical protein